MKPEISGRTRPTKPKKQQRMQKRKRGNVDAEKLAHAVQELEPTANYTSFADLPLSDATLAGLQSAHFSTLTDIQSKAIPLALKGRDILGAAKTGSGKTLAFLIPVLENLYRAQCVGPDAGLGSMIISPTRELAIQIFDVLRTIGRQGHLFAAGLVIGGKSLQEERDALARMNIVVCTPGRILQHLSQTAAFAVDNLRMLVLDEADRILDMGFQHDVDAILEYLPADRQTLLFSATQTKRVSDLARLSLRNPEYISVHESATAATPQTLQQNYVLTPLVEKLDTLWSFLQSGKKSKILVFMSSGKQVRFVYEAFRHMQPGIPLLHLHGRQRQTARLDITERFSKARYSCLFATDVAARGLDFPAVDWVVQVDCPEDADTYIHRVGRTARYERDGRAILFVDPSEEEGILSRLSQKRVPIERINVRAKKQQSIKNQMQSMCFKDPQLKYLGQKAFASYVRSVHVQKDKEIFGLDKYDLEGFAASLGLPGAPRIKFLKADADEIKRRKNAPRDGFSASDDEDAEEVTGVIEGGAHSNTKDRVRTKYDRMFERQNQDILTGHYTKMIHDHDDKDNVRLKRLDEEQSDDDELFNVRQRIPAKASPIRDVPVVADGEDDNSGVKAINIPGAREPLILDSKRRERLLKSKKKVLKLKDKGSKLVFDNAGNAHQIYELEDEDAFKARGGVDDQRRRFLDEEARRAQQADVSDKALAREKKRIKREKKKERGRAGEAETGAVGGMDFEGDEDVLANFIADAQGVEQNDDHDKAADFAEVEPEQKRKKWFERDENHRGHSEAREIETFDDLEAEAARVLG